MGRKPCTLAASAFVSSRHMVISEIICDGSRYCQIVTDHTWMHDMDGFVHVLGLDA